MGACEWYKPALHYFVMLSRYISSCYERYSYYLDHEIPAMFENIFYKQNLTWN